ncbi:hypothetical protein GOODEAATRI_030043, partial [Goodea atripinnis]
VIHGAGAYTIPVGIPTMAWVVITTLALLGDAADGAHGFVLVINCGQGRATPTTSRFHAVMQGGDGAHVVHCEKQ